LAFEAGRDAVRRIKNDILDASVAALKAKVQELERIGTLEIDCGADEHLAFSLMGASGTYLHRLRTREATGVAMNIPTSIRK
jgi:hypothetical protein